MNKLIRVSFQQPLTICVTLYKLYNISWFHQLLKKDNISAFGKKVSMRVAWDNVRKN